MTACIYFCYKKQVVLEYQNGTNLQAQSSKKIEPLSQKVEGPKAGVGSTDAYASGLTGMIVEGADGDFSHQLLARNETHYWLSGSWAIWRLTIVSVAGMRIGVPSCSLPAYSKNLFPPSISIPTKRG